MLPLDSPRWTELRQAYGDASNIPDLLRQVGGGDPAAIHDLYSSICHQDSVYSASFAAVPHLVAAAHEAESPERKADYLILIGCICASRDLRGPSADDDLMRWYEAALPDALSLSLQTLPSLLKPVTAIYMLEAICRLKGYRALGEAMSGFAEKEFVVECPECSSLLYVWPEETGSSVAADDPVRAPKTARTRVEPGPVAGSAFIAQYEWLNSVMTPPARSIIGERLKDLFGSLTCPKCEMRLVLLDEIEKSVR